MLQATTGGGRLTARLASTQSVEQGGTWYDIDGDGAPMTHPPPPPPPPPPSPARKRGLSFARYQGDFKPYEDMAWKGKRSCGRRIGVQSPFSPRAAAASPQPPARRPRAARP